jgi:hypothetical protein
VPVKYSCKGCSKINSLVARVACGSGLLLVKNVARDAKVFAEYWGNALLMTLTTSGRGVGFAKQHPYGRPFSGNRFGRIAFAFC